MNYIKHLNKVLEVMNDDTRLAAVHISLYMALFQQWNILHFKSPMQIKRVDIMQAAKIGSLTTYTKYIKELHEWDYLNYTPSFNAAGSSVHMYSFCNVIPMESSIKSTPAQSDVIAYFKENKWPIAEGNKFFFYYEATGWLTKNNLPITDWKAAAQKWALNKETVNNYGNNKLNGTASKPGKLQASTQKSYSDPL